jgi:hypothetical protein
VGAVNSTESISCADAILIVEKQRPSGQLDDYVAPEKAEQRNQIRAARAAQALKSYAKATKSTREPLETVIEDLIADLRHLALANNIGEGKFSLLQERARHRWYEEEVLQEI